MKMTNLKDTCIRALKTCVQSALAYLSAQLMVGIDINSDKALETLLIGLIGAVLGALSNIHIESEGELNG